MGYGNIYHINKWRQSADCRPDTQHQQVFLNVTLHPSDGHVSAELVGFRNGSFRGVPHSFLDMWDV